MYPVERQVIDKAEQYVDETAKLIERFISRY